MSWRDQLLPASFRNAAFEWDDANGQGARRVVVHQYPLQDIVQTEDLGDGIKQIALTGYVLGADYMTARDALIAALDQPGTGTLVHPTRGRLQVVMQSYEFSESSQQGGIAIFRMQFLRAADVSLPSGTADTGAAVTVAAQAARDVSGASFTSAYAVLSAAQHDSALGTLQSTLVQGARLIDNTQSFVSQQTGKLIAGLLDPVHGARQLLDNVVGLPADTYAQIDDLFNGITRAGNLRGLFDAYTGLPNSPGADLQAKANTSAMQQVLQTQTLTRLTEAMTLTPYSSYDDAEAALQDVLGLIDTLSASADAANYDALQDLRVAIHDDITTRDADLRRITSYMPLETLPALVIAQTLYGPIALEANVADMVARNAIAHPGFVAGGTALEVLTP